MDGTTLFPPPAAAAPAVSRSEFQKLSETIVCDVETARSVLYKFNRGELANILISWGIPYGSDPSYSKSAVIENSLQNELSRGLTNKQLADVELAYYIERHEGRVWTAYKMMDATTGDVLDGEVAATVAVDYAADPAEFTRRMNSHLGVYFRQYSIARSAKGLLWIRVGIQDESWKNYEAKTLRGRHTIIVAHYPRSHALFASPIRSEHREYVLAALARVFGCASIKDCDLVGKDIGNLADLLLNHNGQGLFSSQSLQNVDSMLDLDRRRHDYIQQRIIRKTKRLRGEMDEAVLEEDLAGVKQRENAIRSTFGTSTSHLPRLAKINITVDGKYKGLSALRERLSTSSFPLQVTMTGPSVIEGLRELAQAGILQAPIPSFLADLHSSARSSMAVNEEGVMATSAPRRKS